MTGTLNPPIPTIGEPNSTEDVNIKEGLETLRDGLNAVLASNNELDGQKIKAGTYGDEKYRTVFRAHGTLRNDAASGTYLLKDSEAIASGSNIGGGIMPAFYFNDEDYLVSGNELKMRIRAVVGTNATKPVLTFGVGLYPLTIAGGADELKVTAGTVVENSEQSFVNPEASKYTQKTSEDFAVPVDGVYGLAVKTSASLTNNNITTVFAEVQVRNA